MKLTLNLASRKYINERALKFACLVVCSCLVLLFFSQLSFYLQSRQENLLILRNIEKIEQKLSGDLPKQYTKQEVASQRSELELAKSLLKEDAFRWTALFDRMERLLPKNVSIRSFRPDYNKGSLLITGVAINLNDLRDLIDNLHADSFEQVFLTRQGQVDVFDYKGEKQPALSFSIQLEGVFQ